MIQLKKTFTTFFLIFSISSFAQDFSEIEIQEFDGQLLNFNDDCLAIYNNENNRNLLRGRNERGGSWFYIGVGEADIAAPIDNPRYINSTQNAFTLASLRAKREMAEFLSLSIEDEIIVDTIESVKSGRKPLLVAQEKADLEIRRENYETMGIFDKTILIIHKKLDEWIGEDFNKDSQELQNQLDNILAQDMFKRLTTTAAYSEIRGMKNLFVRISEKKACVVSVYSNKTRRWADALGTDDYAILKAQKNGKLMMGEVIPDKNKPKGLRKLLGSFGLIVDVDRNGEIYLISFAQAGAIDTSATRLNSARKIAQIQAQAQIAQFKREAVDVYSQLEQIEVTTTAASGTKDYYSETNYTDRLNASSKVTMKGIEFNSWWSANHPYTKKPVVGVVLTWNPKAQSFAEKIINENDGF